MSRWPLNKAYFWETAPFFRLVLPLGLGIVSYEFQWFPDVTIPIALTAIFFSAIAVLISGYRKQQNTFQKICFPIALALFFFFAGWTFYAANDRVLQTDYFGKSIDTNSGNLASVLATRNTKSTNRYELELLSAISPGVKSVSGRAYLYVYKRADATGFSVGDTLIIPSKWQAIANSGNPFAFSNVAFQRRNGIEYQQFVSPGQVFLAGKADISRQSFVTEIHNFCDRQLARYVANPSALGLLRAMLLGDEQGFDPELRQAYSQTGIIHIVSISGSHVAMMFLLISSMLFWLRGKHAVWIKYLIGLTVVWLYVLVAGAPPSAVRSAVMFSIVALSLVTAREGQAFNTLMAAAFILLVGKPQWLFALGFQLSFLAVLSILLFYQPLVRLWPQENWLLKRIWQAACVSFAAEILIAPLVIYYFHNFPLSFVVANLVSSVVLGLFTLIGGVAIIAFSWIPPFAVFLGYILGMLVDAFSKLIFLLQGVNPPSFQFLQISILELLLLYAVIISSAIWFLMKKPKAVLIALPALLLFVSSIAINKVLAWRQSKLIVYNAGKQASIEQISGGYYHSIVSADENYYSKAGHTGYYSWRKAALPSSFNNYFEMAGKKVLILQDSTVNQYRGTLPVDILILARPLRKMHIQTVFEAFRPEVVVLAQRASSYHLNRWHDTCIAHQTRLHNVATDGAFVLR